MSTREQRPVGSAYMSLLMLAVALMFLKIPTAMAQADDYTKFGLSVGLFVTDRDSKTRIDASGGFNGTDVDLEADLGLDTSDSVFRVDGYYHFSPKAYGLSPLCLRLTSRVTHTGSRLDTKRGGSPLLGRHFQPLVNTAPRGAQFVNTLYQRLRCYP